MEGGCLGFAGASAVASQSLDRIRPHGWQIPTTQPWPPNPGTRQTDESVEADRVGLVGNTKTTTSIRFTPTQPLWKPLKKKLDDPGFDEATTFHVSLHFWVWLVTGLVAVNFDQFSIELN